MKRTLEDESAFPLYLDIWRRILDRRYINYGTIQFAEDSELCLIELYILRFVSRGFHHLAHSLACKENALFDLTCLRIFIFDNSFNLLQWANEFVPKIIFDPWRIGGCQRSTSISISSIALTRGYIKMFKWAIVTRKENMEPHHWHLVAHHRDLSLLIWMYQKEYGVFPEGYVPNLPEGLSWASIFESGLKTHIITWFVQNFDIKLGERQFITFQTEIERQHYLIQ